MSTELWETSAAVFSRVPKHGLRAVAILLAAMLPLQVGGAPAEQQSSVRQPTTTEQQSAAQHPPIAPQEPTAQQSPKAMPPSEFERSIDMVTLPVFVLDSDGLPVAGLSRQDFVVVDDGVEYETAVLLRPDDSPLELALLIHLSELMDSFAQDGRTSTLSMLDQLSEADCILYLPFHIEHGTGIWGHPGDPDLRARIAEVALGGGSAPNAAVVLGIDRLTAGSSGCADRVVIPGPPASVPIRRQALILLTDGLEQVHVTPFEHAMSDASLADVPVFPIAVGELSEPLSELAVRASDLQPRPGRESLEQLRWLAASQLHQLAKATGGQFITGRQVFSPHWKPETLLAAYDELLLWLRSYHVVGYYPARLAPGSVNQELPVWHEVEVRVRGSGHRVHTRTGYYRSLVDTTEAQSHIVAGTDLLALGQSDNALEEFDLAVEADPYYWEAHYQRGRTLAMLGDAKGAQQALLQAAALDPGRGEVHKLTCLVSLELGDDETAWEQAIRAHQAEMDMTEELRLLREEAEEPPGLEMRLRAPRLFLRTVTLPDPVAHAALRRMSRTLASVVAEVPEMGLIDLEALAEFHLTIEPLELAQAAPRALNAVMTLTDSAGDEIIRMDLILSDIDDQEMVAEELTPHIEEVRVSLTGKGGES